MDISVSDTPVGRLLDGRYRVGERLARGGMATVFEAVDTRLDRVIALKIMNPDYAEDQAFVNRFIGEARSAARLSHPNVVAVFDQGQDQGAVYLAMEYVAGQTLRRVLRDHGRLNPADALDVMEQVLSALAAAHRAGIVHRDVKPENVLVDTDGRIKVTDFGLARAVDGSSTITRGVLLGTAAYISPEQALGEAATFRSDVYSAGIVLFELITGHAPHDGLTDYVIVRKHTENDVPPPSDQDASIPRAIDELVLRSTARDPDRRFADAGEFLAAVRSARRLVSGIAEVEPRETAGVSAAEAFPFVGGVSPFEDTVLSADAVNPEDTSPEIVPIATFFDDQESRQTAVIVRPVEGSPAPPRRERREKAQRRWRGPILFTLVLLLAAGTAVGAWWFGAGRYTTTPSLIRLTEAAAKAEAATVGLSVQTSTTARFSEQIPAGAVIQTEPRPGERIRKGGLITLILSKGPERYEVPELVGKTREAAEGLLADNKLIVGKVTERYDGKVAKGLVISQETKPGTQVTRNTPVSFTVSKGRQPIEIVDFTGKPADEAKKKLEQAGFKVRSTEEFSDSVPRGAVISQDPASGTGFRGDRVSLVVSKGPQIVNVPSVEGKPVKDAENELNNVGLKVRAFTVLPGGPGKVLRQQPGAGTPVPAGSTITLWVF